jgi:hypothetical protein
MQCKSAVFAGVGRRFFIQSPKVSDFLWIFPFSKFPGSVSEQWLLTVNCLPTLLLINAQLDCRPQFTMICCVPPVFRHRQAAVFTVRM